MSHNQYGTDPDQTAGKQSQDALRHQKDALHQKVHKEPFPGVKDATEGDGGEQAEVPRVGSRDAPGG
jgi:hypothetical protein